MELARHERKLATMCCGQFLLVLLMFSLTWKCRYPMIAAQNLLNMKTSGKGSHCPGCPGCSCRLNLMFFCWLNSNLSHCSNSPKVKKNLGSFPPFVPFSSSSNLPLPTFDIAQPGPGTKALLFVGRRHLERHVNQVQGPEEEEPGDFRNGP